MSSDKVLESLHVTSVMGEGALIRLGELFEEMLLTQGGVLIGRKWINRIITEVLPPSGNVSKKMEQFRNERHTFWVLDEIKIKEGSRVNARAKESQHYKDHPPLHFEKHHSSCNFELWELIWLAAVSSSQLQSYQLLLLLEICITYLTWTDQ